MTHNSSSIVIASKVLKVKPFSLESIGIKNHYDNSKDNVLISYEDEIKVYSYLEKVGDESEEWIGSLVSIGDQSQTNDEEIIAFLIEYEETHTSDEARYVELGIERRVRNPIIAAKVKELVNQRCQICDDDQVSRYGVSVCETHHIEGLGKGGKDLPSNLVVLCPTHHALVQATGARFDRQRLSFVYDTGLVEKLRTPSHLGRL